MVAPELRAGHVIDGHTTVQGLMSSSERVRAYEGVRGPRPVVVKLYDPALGEACPAGLRSAAAVTQDLPRGYALEVLDVGVDEESGGAYVVTERAARPSLAHLVQLCPLSPDEVVALVRSLARALGGAHDKGLPHLGLKPTNVFVGAPPSCEVQLADFGGTVARGTLGGGAVDADGAPWVSPEQAFGGMPPGVGSDVFSTALVVFFALTGRSYWRAFGPRSDAGAWSREIWAPRTPASVRAKELGAVLPEAWDVPFARALDVDPARRPRSIAELAASFERASRGEAALEPPPVSLPRFEVLTDASATAAAAAPASVPSTPPEASPAEPARARRGRWIAIGSAAIALLGAGLFVAIRMAPPPATARAATPSSPAPSSSVPAPEASTAVTATPVVATPSAAPSASTSATRPSPAAPPSAPVVPDPGMSTLLVTCNPACDSIWVDGHLAPDASSGKTVTPGVHMIGANLARHPSKVQAVLCKRGQIARFGVDFSP